MGPATLPRYFPTFATWYRKLILLIRVIYQRVGTATMRLLRVRFSARWLMIAVALLVISLGLMQRRSRALALAEHHRSQIVSQIWVCGKGSSRIYHYYVDGLGNPPTTRQIKSSEWHRKLYSKYLRASHYPWLPIESDPPEPE